MSDEPTFKSLSDQIAKDEAEKAEYHRIAVKRDHLEHLILSKRSLERVMKDLAEYRAGVEKALGEIAMLEALEIANPAAVTNEHLQTVIETVTKMRDDLKSEFSFYRKEIRSIEMLFKAACGAPTPIVTPDYGHCRPKNDQGVDYNKYPTASVDGWVEKQGYR